MQVIDICEIQV